MMPAHGFAAIRAVVCSGMWPIVRWLVVLVTGPLGMVNVAVDVDITTPAPYTWRRSGAGHSCRCRWRDPAEHGLAAEVVD